MTRVKRQRQRGEGRQPRGQERESWQQYTEERRKTARSDRRRERDGGAGLISRQRERSGSVGTPKLTTERLEERLSETGSRGRENGRRAGQQRENVKERVSLGRVEIRPI